MGVRRFALESKQRRSVASLSLAEQIVIWGLRRYQAAGAGLAPLEPMFNRIFGPREADWALERFARLIERLDHLPRADEASFLDQRLSRTETLLLELMAILHRAERTRAEGFAAGFAEPGDVDRLLTVAADFAAALGEAGFPLAEREPAARAGRAPPEPRIALLPAALLAEDAAPGLHAILHHTSVVAERQVDVRCLACRLLSPDEARLLHAVACGQRGELGAALNALCAWLAPTAARLTLEAVGGLARAFTRAGIHLPLRRWDFDRLTRLTEAASATTEPESCTIH